VLPPLLATRSTAVGIWVRRVVGVRIANDYYLVLCVVRGGVWCRRKRSAVFPTRFLQTHKPRSSADRSDFRRKYSRAINWVFGGNARTMCCVFRWRIYSEEEKSSSYVLGRAVERFANPPRKTQYCSDVPVFRLGIMTYRVDRRVASRLPVAFDSASELFLFAHMLPNLFWNLTLCFG